MATDQVVWYFDRPTIGYCRACQMTGVYIAGALRCPVDPVHHELSIFEWDGCSPDPEGDDDE